ncbi:MAG: helix-turn-helix domain-containing protein [Planctomycetota bacterium]
MQTSPSTPGTMRVALRHAYRGQVPEEGRDRRCRVAWWACYRIDRGSARVRMAGEEVRLAPGAWVVLPPAVERLQMFSADARICSVNLVAEWSDGRPLLDVAAGVQWPQAPALDRAVAGLLRASRPLFRVVDGHLQRRSGSVPQRLHAEAACLRFAAVWYGLPIEQGIAARPAQLTDERVARALALLDPHAVGRRVPYPQLRQACGLARAQIDRLVRAASGRSPKQLLDERALGGAQELLCAGDTPIKAIAQRFGFTDTAHFTRWFSTRVGRSPAAFRRDPG